MDFLRNLIYWLIIMLHNILKPNMLLKNVRIFHSGDNENVFLLLDLKTEL